MKKDKVSFTTEELQRWIDYDYPKLKQEQVDAFILALDEESYARLQQIFKDFLSNMESQ